jgi:two-component system, OmpR family, sensor kinase
VSLQRRLLLGVLCLVAVGVLATDVLTYRALRSFLLERTDQQLEGAVVVVAERLAADRRSPRGAPRAVVPTGTYGALVDPGGGIVATVAFGYEDDPSTVPRPAVDASDLRRREPFTTAEAGGDGVRFRAVVSPLADGSALVVAVPLRDVTQTLRRLVAIEALASVAVLAAVGAVSASVVRAGLRPLEDIEATARAIAAGDLGRRVERAEPRTEVGRLGLSLNAMLEQIQTAFDARQASEERLRRFVADASHELRTPLTSIRGYAELFRRGAATRPEELADAMRRIEEEATRMGVLVDDLLLLARLDQGRPLEKEPVDLARLAADAVGDARAVEPGRPIVFEQPPPTVVLGDEARLRQVAANLLANVRRHTPPATPVRVEVRTDGPTAVLEVADEGPGLPPDQAARIFERFYRADPSRTRAHGGTGLGLSIVAAIVEAHGGRARVDTAPGAGARFSVELPHAPDVSLPSSDG